MARVVIAGRVLESNLTEVAHYRIASTCLCSGNAPAFPGAQSKALFVTLSCEQSCCSLVVYCLTLGMMVNGIANNILGWYMFCGCVCWMLPCVHLLLCPESSPLHLNNWILRDTITLNYMASEPGQKHLHTVMSHWGDLPV